MPGIMSSYRSCIMPRIPTRGLRSDITIKTFLRNGRCWAGLDWRSALPVLLLVAPVQRVDLRLRDRGERAAEGAGQVHGPGRVLAHHRGFHRVARGRSDSEHAV